MTRIQLRRDTAANFTSGNPVLAQGEPALETDTRKWKIGNGSSTWNALGYMPAGTITSVAGQTGPSVSLTKTDVGLGNADNTSDANKPVSTATNAALNLKAPLASPVFTGTVSGITKTMVGLGSVDNTADTAKPVSTAQQTALNLKADAAATTTALAAKSDVGHQHVVTDIVDLDVTNFQLATTGLNYLKWNGTTYPARSTATSDPNKIVVYVGGPGPSKSGTGSTGAVTGDWYVA